ncbi:MAG: DUF4215 domain-containing protein, partial [Deltaproteobacteria bacterium]|nr:DUF4215 domain-containing protein [Deltaproteobacteria bacterium]
VDCGRDYCCAISTLGVLTCWGKNETISAYQASSTVCGDGIKGSSEQCDDGNTSDGDTCSSTCSEITVGCADGTVEGGLSLWQREDIVFCTTSDGELPTSASNAGTLCASGWTACTSAEYVARNDNCTAGVNFSVVLNDGDNCMMHADGRAFDDDDNPAWQCRHDTVRAGFVGSCSQEATSGGSFSMRSYDAFSSGASTLQGTVCCSN